MFVEPATRDSAAYREFRASLNRGEYQSAEYKRIGKGGMEVWILASYNPIIDEKGRPFKVVKFATDVTEQKLRTADLAGQINLLALNATIEGLSRREPNSPDAPAYPMKCTVKPGRVKTGMSATVIWRCSKRSQPNGLTGDRIRRPRRFHVGMWRNPAEGEVLPQDSRRKRSTRPLRSGIGE